MAYCEFKNVSIKGIACAVPTNIKNNADCCSPEEFARFTKKIGVKTKRFSNLLQTSSDLGFEAAKKLLNAKNIDPKSIDALIFLTQNPDYRAPSTAYVLSKRLGLSKDAMPFDVNLGCSAFTYGIHLASSFINGANMSRILLIIADVTKKGFVDERDEMLFGDCGSAVLLESSDDTIKSLLKSDGNRYDALISPIGGQRHPVDASKDYYAQICSHMNGADVMSFGVTDVPATIKEFLQISKSKITDFDKIILNQTNLLMLQTISKLIGVDFANVPISMDRFGNTNGSSILLTLVDAKMREILGANSRILSSGFGIGLSWGVNSFKINSNDILPLIETDEYYKEAY